MGWPSIAASASIPRPPADDADAADHRRVAVRPHEGVGEEPLFAVTLAGVDDLSEVFEIHLVNDTRSRRDDTEIVERLLSPFERTVSLAVALVPSLTFFS